MKKCIFILGFLWSTLAVHARGRIGVQMSPSLSFGNVHTFYNEGFSSTGAALCIKIGAGYDYPLKLHDNCFVGTGLFYSSLDFAIENTKISPIIEEVHALHYLQIPLLLKLYTTELMLDARLYVALGAIGQLRVKERNTKLKKNQQDPLIEEFARLGTACLLAVGIEYDLGLSLSVFGGLSYQF